MSEVNGKLILPVSHSSSRGNFTVIALNQTRNALNRTRNALKCFRNPLEAVRIALEHTRIALEATRTALERVRNAFSRTRNALERRRKALEGCRIAFLRARKTFPSVRHGNYPDIRIFKGQRAGCPFYLFTGKLIQRKKNKMKKVLSLVLALILSASYAQAQTAEVSIQLNEQFFEALLDAIFKNSAPPEFPLTGKRVGEPGNGGAGEKVSFVNAAFNIENGEQIANRKSQIANCSESIRLQREIDGVRTAVRLRDGKIFAPLAFTGSYNPPLIGCIDFSGVAQTNIDLSFDARRQALVGRATVLSVNLSGAGGIGSGVIANMVQSSIDRRVNPIEIIRLDKISFVVPIQNSNALKMKAVGIKNEIVNGALNVRIQYEFQKAE